MPKLPVTVLLISASRPMRLAVYDRVGAKLESFESDAPATESFYPLFKAIDEKYAIEKLAYARGPGSFMGLKLGYVFMQTLALARNLPFTAASSFVLSDGAPVQAHGKRWFAQEANGIGVKLFEAAPEDRLLPPDRLDLNLFDTNTEPDYFMPAV